MDLIQKGEIELSIFSLKGKVSDLDQKSEQYRQMKIKISKAIEELNSAKRQVEKASSALTINCKGKSIEKKAKEMSSEVSSISGVINSLISVSTECEAKMNEIKAQKQKTNDEIRKLQKKLNDDN